MSLSRQQHSGGYVRFDPSWIEQKLLQIVDLFDIRVWWDLDTAVLTGVFAVAGGFLGGYAGNRIGAALGAGIGGVAGYGVSKLVSLRQIWDTVKEKLKELLYIVFNFLRRLDPADYVRAYDILMACSASRRELVITIVDFLALKLDKKVFSNITAA